MNILPKELCNEIYKYRATYELKDICQDYYLSFNKFCHFLQKYKAVLAGSCAIHCIDLRCGFSDLDIFIKSVDEPYFMQYCDDFLKVFTIKRSLIKRDCCPIKQNSPDETENMDENDTENKNDLCEHYVLSYLDKKIDLTVFSRDPKEILLTHNKFDISSIIFDGKEWNVPFDNISDLLFKRKINLVDPYFDKIDMIYDPWADNAIVTMIRNVNKLSLDSEDGIWWNHQMSHVLKELGSFYDKKDEFHLNQKLTNMFDLYNKITGSSLIVPNSVLIQVNYYRCNEQFSEFTALYQRMKQKFFIPNHVRQTITNWISDCNNCDFTQMRDDHYQRDDSKNDAIMTPEELSIMKEIYHFYRGWYYILKYILKGYHFENMTDFYPDAYKTFIPYDKQGNRFRFGCQLAMVDSDS